MKSSDPSPLQIMPEEVQALGKFASDVAIQLKSGASSLDRDVQSLFASWNGRAADAYRNGWDEVYDGATKTWDALAELAEKLGVNASQFQNLDVTNASSIATVQEG